VISKQWLKVVTVAGVLALGLAACGGDDDADPASSDADTEEDAGDEPDEDSEGEELSGSILIDGSSTVAPLSETAAELFQMENSGVQVTVGTSGTGGGFERFCIGETDISDASRPIADDEVDLCGENGVEYAEVQVANDALSAVVHPDNPLTCISIEALNQMWDLDTPVDSWGDIEGLETEVPDEPLTLFGPGSDSGTYDYWTDAVNGEEGRIRTDYNSIGEDDSAAVNGVASDPWASAYIPFSYVTTAGDSVKALQILNPNTGECVEPTLDNVLVGEYAPLGRPLFIYPSGDALQRPEVLAFLDFYLVNQETITTEATFIPMNDEQLAESQARVADLHGGS
jgi:phosphate transport system substrate-binding protein